jgi:hypothetical protein
MRETERDRLDIPAAGKADLLLAGLTTCGCGSQCRELADDVGLSTDAFAEFAAVPKTEPHEGLLTRLLAWLETSLAGNELERMSADDVRNLAHDIGLDASELVRLAAGESDAARLLYARLEQLGFTMAEIEAEGAGSARDMERACGLCAERGLCEHDLRERPESPAWRKICPNNWTFEVMERLKAARA